jgi:hypothetical protein
MGDLVRRSDTIARHILALEPSIDALLQKVAAHDAAPVDADPADARRRKSQSVAWGACLRFAAIAAAVATVMGCGGIARSMSARIPIWLRSPRITAPIVHRWSALTACPPPHSDAYCRNWLRRVRSFAIMAISIGPECGSATTSCASTAPNPGALARPTTRPPSKGPQVLDRLSRERLPAHCGTKSALHC